jgi:hypothetical protein
MATTNWTTAEVFQANLPHTFNALQHLVMAMSDFVNSRGKKSFFGKDKGLAEYKKFEEKLKDTLLAMVLDGVIERNAAPSHTRTDLGSVNTNGHFYEILRTWKSPTHSIAKSSRVCRRNAAT